MLKISRAVEYGLIAVDFLSSHPGKLVRARDLSEELDLPAGIIAKVLQRMTTAGIVTSEQGARGGYRLARNPEQISFLELSRAIDARQHISPCSDDSECDRRDTCTVSGPVAELDSQISNLLSNINLEALLHSRAGQGGRI